jgi:hypothetical protein
MTFFNDLRMLVVILNLLLAVAGIGLVTYHMIGLRTMQQPVAAEDKSNPDASWMRESALRNHDNFITNGLLAVVFLLANAYLLFNATAWLSHIVGVADGIVALGLLAYGVIALSGGGLGFSLFLFAPALFLAMNVRFLFLK